MSSCEIERVDYAAEQLIELASSFELLRRMESRDVARRTLRMCATAARERAARLKGEVER